MDTSDGLIATLDQLARLNGVGIRVETTFSSLLHPRVEALRAAARLPAFAFVASCHGEFELVFASYGKRSGADLSASALIGALNSVWPSAGRSHPGVGKPVPLEAIRA